MADTELNGKILRQVEYYFGDINLSKDTFMKKTLEEKDGWLPFDTLLKFKRLNQLSRDVEIIKKAIADSELVEVSEAGIRRLTSKPPPENISKALTIHSDKALYVKGFPAESTLDELLTWIEGAAGETYDVFLRRLPSRKFKGSIYITFKTKESADKFMTSEDCAEYKGSHLLRKWYTEYLEDKKNERLAKIEEKTKKQERKKAEITSQMTAGALIELSGLPESAHKANEKPVPSVDAPKEVTDDVEKQNIEEKDDVEKQNIEEKDDIEKSKTGENPSSEKKANVEMHSVSQLKAWLNEKLESTVQIAWIDVQPAENKAIVRFKESNTAAVALEKLTKSFDDGKIMYQGSQLSGRVVVGDEEKDFWKNLLTLLTSKKRKSGNRDDRGRFGKRRRHN